MNQYNPAVLSENYIDGVVFTKNDPCLFTIWVGGGAGDLLNNLINYHYLNTGCSYWGIADTGQVAFLTTDYNLLADRYPQKKENTFSEQFFYDFNENLGGRNLTYSLLDQVIMGTHEVEPECVKLMLDSFPKCQIIRFLPKNKFEYDITQYLHAHKYDYIYSHEFPNVENKKIPTEYPVINDKRVLDINFKDFFTESTFDVAYDQIVKFLGFPGKMIRFDYVQYWIDKQPPEIQLLLTD